MASTPANKAQGQEQISFDAAHAQLRADDGIQFDLEPFKPKPPPEWLEAVLRFLIEAWPVLRIGFWIVVGGIALFILYKLARHLAGAKWPWQRDAETVETSEWQIAEAPARALLQEADRLAADGRFDEAAHLLLFRSIEEIERRRPKLVRPALTSRDIAGAPDLPDAPRSAFATIVGHVERSLFGGATLQAPDWQRCREAYENFAFPKAWAR